MLKPSRSNSDGIEKRVSALEASLDCFELHIDRRFNEVMNGINQLIRFSVIEQRLSQLESNFRD
jgi:hypothetical protein